MHFGCANLTKCPPLGDLAVAQSAGGTPVSKSDFALTSISPQ